ncbi:MAG: pyruvate dehydrogenase (acetyl-transferring) E1 component subunit alpha [Chlamydiales bacterium]
MEKKEISSKYTFFSHDPTHCIEEIGKKQLLSTLEQMLLIRNFEIRAEFAYQQGKIGGFFHSYTGQEAIQTAAIVVFGQKNWWITTYRCHALALLTGATPNEIMAELYGKSTGNAKGRGGSMHLYSSRLLGGFGIVGGHLPIAAGAALSMKYLKRQTELSICFLGEGAVAQGAFHETLNICSLWELPIIFVIENNQWGMGTAVDRAICVRPIAEHFAKSYNMSSYTLDGMDFVNCFAAFHEAKKEILKTKRPILIEAVTDRFRGHSISDPALYRSKAEVKKIQKRDPIVLLNHLLQKMGWLTEKEYEEINDKQKQIVLLSMQFAEESPWPDPTDLESGVYA